MMEEIKLNPSKIKKRKLVFTRVKRDKREWRTKKKKLLLSLFSIRCLLLLYCSPNFCFVDLIGSEKYHYVQSPHARVSEDAECLVDLCCCMHSRFVGSRPLSSIFLLLLLFGNGLRGKWNDQSFNILPS